MFAYIVSYDLRKQRDYAKLYEAIKSYNGWAYVLESTWVVLSSKSAVEVRDHLGKHIDGDDGLFVVRSGGTAAWKNVLCRNAWLKENL